MCEDQRMSMVALVSTVFACSGIVALYFHCNHPPSHAASAGAISNRVDFYNSVTGTWSTAQLSVARYDLAATSVGNMALFAGGWTQDQGGACRLLWLFRPLAYVAASVLWRCYTYHRLRHHALICRWYFECCGLVQQCDRDVVDGSAERGARSACSRVGWEHGAVRWRRRDCAARE